jgi:hypothetical protein
MTARLVAGALIGLALVVLGFLLVSGPAAPGAVPAAPRPGPAVVTPSTYGPPGPAGGPG